MASLTEQERVDQVKRITADLEETYQSLRKVARNISALLVVGRATCDEVKTYNLFALATYDAQRGMLTHLRSLGDKSAPVLPDYPTLFELMGATRENGYRIDCGKQASSLSGALSAAFASAAQPDTIFLSSKQIRIVTQDPNVFTPESNLPSLEELSQRGATAGLDGAFIFIIIGGIALGLVTAIVVAFSTYLQERKIQEQTTERTKIQAKAFENYTAARMSCYDSCLSKSGSSVDGCIKVCKSLIDKPKLDVTPRSGLSKEGFGTFGTIGLFVVVGLGGFTLFKLYKRGTFDRFKSSSDASELPEGTA